MEDGRALPTPMEGLRASYDTVADRYVELMDTTGMADITTQPWLACAVDRFAEEVRELGPVLDVGCGPGQVSAYLAARGVDVSGVDLSPRMIDHARKRYPGLRFDVGSVTDLRLGECSLGGVLAWWSLFNLPRETVPGVLASFRDALVPGGALLLATHEGDGDVEKSEAYGVPVSWTTYRWLPDRLVEIVEAAGLDVEAELRLAGGDDHGPALVLLARRCWQE